MLLLAGCGPKRAGLADAMNRYDRGLYATSQAMASTVAGQSSGNAKAQAAYVAGMSALRQTGQEAAAGRWLSEATLSSDPHVSARAEAMLGELDRRAGNVDGAVAHWQRAWPGLSPDEQHDTATAAVSTLKATGDEQAAAAWAHRLNGSDAVPSTGAWTLQAGAFTSRSSADAQRRSLNSRATRAGLGAPRVHHSERASGDLWLVHLGAFDSRTAAAAARRQLSGTDLLIVRVP
ncbi:MAG: SPOR domain-containing protein [Phycisphaerales bacterium]|nr:SPOR domain-containing protein [Phycisphaerales bacterium]